MSWREISPEKLCTLREPLLVDVRSPGEHKAENIPGSINVPLLSDSERAEVGTVYVQKGEALARRLALRLVGPKVAPLIESIIDRRRQGQAVVVHCWRGGLRSEAVASFLSIVGIDCFRLSGGYKAWRNMLLRDFAGANYHFKPFVLHGLTGTGKTEVLHLLAETGVCVLDLEGLANHRGSAFGGVGLGGQTTQKNFEAELWLKLKSFGKEPVLLEAESRKIGKINLPDFVMSYIASGRRILLTASLEKRADRLVADYASSESQESKEALTACTASLKERLGKKQVAEICRLIEGGELYKAAETLLRDYYDPLYLRHIKANEPYELIVNGENPVEAAAQIKDWLSKIPCQKP